MDKFDFKSKIAFWNDKILPWEKSRYGKNFHPNIEPKNSVQSRYVFSHHFLKPFINDRIVIELGCGSGLFAESLVALNPRSYVGFDFSQSAIKRAKERLSHCSNFEFNCTDVDQIQSQKCDVVFSLGLLDWLDNSSIHRLSDSISAKYFLHSFSSDELTTLSLLHRCMVFLQYGFKTKKYVPKYRSSRLIKDLLSEKGSQVFQHPSLSFGRLIHNLEITNVQ